MSWTLTTSGAAIAKAGEYADADIVASGSTLLEWSNQAEGFICTTVRKDIVTDWASLTANGKAMISRLASSLIAQHIIMYNPRNYTAKAEYETMLDLLETDIDRDIGLLKNDNNRKYLGIT